MNLLLFPPFLAQYTITPARSGAPLRVFAAILLVGILCALIYVLRHLAGVKKELKDDDVLRTERGPRNNMIFIVCAVTFIAVCLLLFLLLKA